MKKHLRLFIPLLVLMMILAACSAKPTPAILTPEPGTSTTGSSGVEVAIKDFAFNPPDLSIKVGTTVTWTNNDGVGHTVTSTDGVFESGVLAKGQTFSYTFNTAGTFPYHCTPHQNMTATITVTN